MKAWFIFDGQALPIAKATNTTFKAAVLALVPQWAQSPTYGGMLASTERDVIKRCVLEEGRKHERAEERRLQDEIKAQIRHANEARQRIAAKRLATSDQAQHTLI